MTNRILASLAVLAAAACGGGAPAAPTGPGTPNTTPPFSGTIFIDPDIITASDPTTFQGLTAKRQALRTMFDRRVNAFVQLQPYLFDAAFSDGLTTEVQVNPEFGSTEAARAQADKYAIVIGRLPKSVGQGDLYLADGILEETFVHEAAHTSLDAAHASSAGWVSAQTRDPVFISTYARDNPQREDIAESVLPWLAVRYRSERISSALAATILQTIPNRIAYFDGLTLVMAPVD